MLNVGSSVLTTTLLTPHTMVLLGVRAIILCHRLSLIVYGLYDSYSMNSMSSRI